MLRAEALDRDAVWRAIDAQRLSLTGLLAQLTDDEWRRPSLCAGWTVRDVASHLTFAQARMSEALGALVRARGDMQRAIRDGAIRVAGRPTGQLIAEIRDMVGSQRHIQGVTHRETLIDILVHSQDIAVPLGRPLAVPPDAAAFAATRVWQSHWRLWPHRRLAGFAFTATDVDFSVGAGRAVHGPIDAILLLLTGRDVGLPRLYGEGAAALATRLAAVGPAAGVARADRPPR
jgi:uncharacterized protein (TIGR03083 family)